MLVADELDGPFTGIKDLAVVCECAPEMLDPVTKTFRQHFTGFYATSRFIRLTIVRNHGAAKTIFQGITFFGADSLLRFSALLRCCFVFPVLVLPDSTSLGVRSSCPTAAGSATTVCRSITKFL